MMPRFINRSHIVLQYIVLLLQYKSLSKRNRIVNLVGPHVSQFCFQVTVYSTVVSARTFQRDFSEEARIPVTS
jgi:hypothetical protein